MAIQSRRNADFPTFPTGPSRSPHLRWRVKAPRARGARSPHTRDDVRRVVERIGAGGFEEDEEGGELPSVGAIVDARPPAAREGAAEEGEGDAPESSDDEDDEDDGSSNRTDTATTRRSRSSSRPTRPLPSVANHKKVTGEENPAWRGGRVGKGAPEELSWGRSRWRWRSEGREGRGWMGFVWDSRRHTLRIDVLGH